jgi:outer membrane lipoprotein-sorting protein
MSIQKTLLLITSVVIAFGIQAQDPKAILEKAEDNRRGTESSKAEVTMIIQRPDWQRQISMKNWTKGDDYSLIYITAPARDEGTAFLKRGHEIWNWQPTIERTIKMPPSMMSQSWMGSDFTNEDLVNQSSIVDDYNHKYLGKEEIDGRMAHKIEMIPKEGTPVIWGKIISWIDTERYVELRSEFYDEDGELINTMTTDQVEKVESNWVPMYLEMIPADEPGHKTIIQQENIEFNVGLDQGFFTIQNMKRID